MTRELRDIVRGKVVVLGAGHALRADDAAGSVVAEELRPRFPGRVFDGGMAPENFAGPIRRAGPGTLLIVDAADFGGAPGEVRVAAPDEVVGLMMGTHAPPLSVLMSILAEDTGADVYLVAVQVVDTRLGGIMTPEVRSAVGKLVAELGRLMDEPNEAPAP
jgi:hydrogenase 3 maturation protease